MDGNNNAFQNPNGRKILSSKEGIEIARQQGNINMSTEHAIEVMPFSETALKALEQETLRKEEFERKKKARQILVPTLEKDVIAKLREYGKPIQLFGERPEHRRARLKEVMLDHSMLMYKLVSTWQRTQRMNELEVEIKKEQVKLIWEDYGENFQFTDSIIYTKRNQVQHISNWIINEGERYLESIEKTMDPTKLTSKAKAEEEKAPRELFYTQLETNQLGWGIPKMVEARKFFVKKSAEKAHFRLNKESFLRESFLNKDVTFNEEEKSVMSLYYRYSQFSLHRTILREEKYTSHDLPRRPLTCCKLSPASSHLSSSFQTSSSIQNASSSSMLNMNSSLPFFSSDYLATGSSGGIIEIWNNNKTSQKPTTFKAHEDKINKLDWYGEFASTSSTEKLNTDAMELDIKENQDNNPATLHKSFLISGSSDCKSKIWDVSNPATPHNVHTLIASPVGSMPSNAPVTAVKFHTFGKHAFTGSSDTMWRTWDIETGQELLIQEGHAKGIKEIDVHVDGSLVATGDESGIGHIWDLRSGKRIWTMGGKIAGLANTSSDQSGEGSIGGHSGRILTMTWSPNGIDIASGGDDNLIKIWDLRKKKNLYSIPGHNKLVSCLKYNQNGSVLVSSSFDNTCKIWNTRDFRLIKALTTQHGLVMACDVAANDEMIVTVGQDHTFKQWYI